MHFALQSWSRGSLIHGATGWGVDEAAAAGRPRSWLVLSTSGSLYGRGAGPSDAEGLLSRSSQGSVAPGL